VCGRPSVRPSVISLFMNADQTETNERTNERVEDLSSAFTARRRSTAVDNAINRSLSLSLSLSVFLLFLSRSQPLINARVGLFALSAQSVRHVSLTPASAALAHTSRSTGTVVSTVLLNPLRAFLLQRCKHSRATQ